jgi:hypothetical protein
MGEAPGTCVAEENGLPTRDPEEIGRETERPELMGMVPLPTPTVKKAPKSRKKGSGDFSADLAEK